MFLDKYITLNEDTPAKDPEIIDNKDTDSSLATNQECGSIGGGNNNIMVKDSMTESYSFADSYNDCYSIIEENSEFILQANEAALTTITMINEQTNNLYIDQMILEHRCFLENGNYDLLSESDVSGTTKAYVGRIKEWAVNIWRIIQNWINNFMISINKLYKENLNKRAKDVLGSLSKVKYFDTFVTKAYPADVRNKPEKVFAVMRSNYGGINNFINKINQLAAGSDNISTMEKLIGKNSETNIMSTADSINGMSDVREKVRKEIFGDSVEKKDAKISMTDKESVINAIKYLSGKTPSEFTTYVETFKKHIKGTIEKVGKAIDNSSRNKESDANSKSEASTLLVRAVKKCYSLFIAICNEGLSAQNKIFADNLAIARRIISANKEEPAKD